MRRCPEVGEFACAAFKRAQPAKRLKHEFAMAVRPVVAIPRKVEDNIAVQRVRPFRLSINNPRAHLDRLHVRRRDRAEDPRLARILTGNLSSRADLRFAPDNAGAAACPAARLIGRARSAPNRSQQCSRLDSSGSLVRRCTHSPLASLPHTDPITTPFVRTIDNLICTLLGVAAYLSCSPKPDAVRASSIRRSRKTGHAVGQMEKTGEPLLSGAMLSLPIQQIEEGSNGFASRRHGAARRLESRRP